MPDMKTAINNLLNNKSVIRPGQPVIQTYNVFGVLPSGKVDLIESCVTLDAAQEIRDDAVLLGAKFKVKIVAVTGDPGSLVRR